MTRDMKNLQLVREQIERVKQDLQDGIAKEKVLNSLHCIDLSLKNIVLSLSQDEISQEGAKNKKYSKKNKKILALFIFFALIYMTLKF